MKRLPCLIAILILVCMLVTCCALGGLAVWWQLNPDKETIVQLPADPSPTPGPASASALETEARLNAAVVPIHDPVALRTLFTIGPPPERHARQQIPYEVGERRRFIIDDPVEAELIHVTEHTYTWLVTGVDADQEALVAAAERFEREIYPTVRRAFGTEWSPGIDNDVRLSILHYADRADDAAGYFAPSDELPAWIDDLSNEAEMFYINLDGMDPDEDFYFAVLAHEFQHMVHWQNDRNETDWLDEALAELACRMTGFDPGSSDEVFLDHPDTQLNHWPYEDDTTPHYGAGYLFALYLWERFGDELIWNLAHHPADGMAALDAVLPDHASLTSEEVFADWVVVNAVNSGDQAYVHEERKSDVGIDVEHSRFPVEVESTVQPYATDYVELTGQGVVDIEFWGASQAELLPVTPHSGETAWWSNRGNRSNAHLIRHLDLSGLSTATLRFWTWYEIERRYDHVYLTASNDGGRSWQVLDPEEAAYQGDYGPAYSGDSGGWIEEEVDLTAYAGREIWIRFDYVTDDTINDAGFLIDDLSVPELGLHDPCEDEGGWTAEGFVLAGQRVPQRWIVQSIAFPAGGGTAHVERMELDASQTGTLAVDLDDAERVLLAISATARGVTGPADYRYQITR
jgi:hypothetical protein